MRRPLAAAAFFLSLALLAAASLATTAMAKRGDDSARASKNGTAQATIDGVAVTVEYGRPKVRGRVVWGGLVPYGKVWRTGADEATTIAFDKDVEIEGQPLAAGTYALFTIPGEKTWTVVFNRQAEQWGAFGYDTAHDALRVEVMPTKAEATEEFTIAIDGDRVVLSWAELAVAFTVAAAG